MTRLRILLAEDHAIVREGLRLLVNNQADMEVVGEAGDGKEAILQAHRLLPDIIVMDLTMPELSGSKATQMLNHDLPHVKILALSVHEDVGYLRELITAGAMGYVLKRSAADELIKAIRTVAANKTYLDPALSSQVVNQLFRQDPIPLEQLATQLSGRESEVLRLIASGFSNKEIASQLNISVKTVETYKARALEKTGLHSRSEIVRFAIEQGWMQE